MTFIIINLNLFTILKDIKFIHFNLCINSLLVFMYNKLFVCKASKKI